MMMVIVIKMISKKIFLIIPVTLKGRFHFHYSQ